MRRPAVAWLAIALTGCALTEKAAPVEIRYFSPEPYGAGVMEATATPKDTEHRELRLGRIGSGPHLRGRIVYRATSHELGSYETLRWTDNPEAYLRREIHRALFAKRPLSERVGGRAPVVEIELLAFEEVRRNDARSGRVALHFSVRDETRVLADGEVEVERKADGTDIESVVAAISSALAAAADETAARVLASLSTEGTARTK